MICVSPLSVTHNEKTYAVPCGVCFSCLNRYVSDWTVRGNYELSQHNYTAYFITLTYNDFNLPSNYKLSKIDIDLFYKRLRKYVERFGTVHFKYFGVGEYGGKFGRPHYHFILFGFEFLSKIGNTTYVLRQIIEKTWDKGFIDISPLRYNNVGYILKYIVKYKFTMVGKNPKDYKEDFKPLIFSSRRPAIGKLTDCDLNKLIDKITCISEPNDMSLKINGYRRAIPRYWLKQLPKEVYFVYQELAMEFSEQTYYDYINDFKGIKSQYDSLRIKAKKRYLSI